MATVAKGQVILAEHMNGKAEGTALVALAKAIDDKFATVVFVGTDAEWNKLTATQQAKYIFRGVPR